MPAFYIFVQVVNKDTDRTEERITPFGLQIFKELHIVN